MASTSSHNHIPVFFQDDVGVIIKVKNRDGIQLSWCTTWFGDILRIHKVNLFPNRNGRGPVRSDLVWAWSHLEPSQSTHQGLYDGVVGGIHVCIEWEGTLSVTVVGSIAFGCNDPVLVIRQKEAVKDHPVSLCHLHSWWPREKALITVHSMGT